MDTPRKASAYCTDKFPKHRKIPPAIAKQTEGPLACTPQMAVHAIEYATAITHVGPQVGSAFDPSHSSFYVHCDYISFPPAITYPGISLGEQADVEAHLSEHNLKAVMRTLPSAFKFLQPQDP